MSPPVLLVLCDNVDYMYDSTGEPRPCLLQYCQFDVTTLITSYVSN